ncbi:MAG TPA: TRAM domain-containing protein [Jatrophihabitantaceae bacterium]|nr:TRAM domain-containing protein [Jatrophihabitantaceae bacterium]
MAPTAETSLAGKVLELTVGAVAHGGHCVARVQDAPGGRVVFVRHALPGERVRALVVEDAGGSFCRADAVEVLLASPDRVAAPCRFAGPGHCGGCDWQHASAQAQLALKSSVLREQFHRLAGLDVDVAVEALPGGLLGWRTRTTYATDRRGRLGLRRHRSHEVEQLSECLLGAPGIGDASELSAGWPGVTAIEVARGDEAVVSRLEHRSGGARPRHGRRPPDAVRLVDGPATLTYRAAEREFTVSAGGFWQVHPAAADTLCGALLEMLAPGPGEQALDLYCGAGLFTAALAGAVGEEGAVVGIESNAGAVADATVNLAGMPWATVRQARVSRGLITDLELRPSLVVLDPPRAGAGAEIMSALLDAGPRAIGYVACDPAALARDVATAVAQGWRMTAIRAFDAFPMTGHMECVALLLPG